MKLRSTRRLGCLCFLLLMAGKDTVTGQVADAPTRGLPTRGLADAAKTTKTKHAVAGGIRELSSPRLVQYASCLVRELTSPRDAQSASRPVRELAIRELAYPRVVQ